MKWQSEVATQPKGDRAFVELLMMAREVGLDALEGPVSWRLR
jgi:hypothetical protein